MNHQERQALRLRLFEVLASAQRERTKRLPEGVSSSSPSWFRFEMETLLAAINWERAKLDIDPCPMRALLRVEKQAAGHSDYSDKMAIYATELVTG